jgi:ubiquinone/menaquinone biosynthesis C-methylase UbiE
MRKNMTHKKAIAERYSGLAEGKGCLSCGGALRYSEVNPGEVCVDLGSGRGNDVFRLSTLTGKHGFVYGIDVAEGMVRKARETALRLCVENAAFVQSEFQAIDVDDGTADLVVSNCAINHAEDKSAVWAEINRILKSGGRFVVSDIYAIDEIPKEHRDNPQFVAECWAGASTRDEYLATVQKAGFDNLRILEESLPYRRGKALLARFTLSGKKSRKNESAH